MDISSFITC